MLIRHMARIITIGSATKDIFFPTEDGLILETPEDVVAQRKIAFELGAKYDIEKRYETLGGCSVNVAVGLARLGLETACYAPIGDDMVGTWIVENLAKENVEVQKLKKIAGAASDLSAIVVEVKSGERTIFSNHDASRKLKLEEEFIETDQWIFAGDLSGDWKGNMEVILKKAQAQKMKIAFNPRQQMLHDDVQEVARMIGMCDLLFVNKDEAIEIVQGVGKDGQDINDEKYLLQVLNELGCKISILTDGVRGAWSFDGEKILHVEVILQKALDVTGSGDAFASGFLGAILKEKTVEEALKWGIANSSSSVTKYGGQAGLLSENEIIALAEKVVID